jgi:OPT oligopeptide transporter protein
MGINYSFWFLVAFIFQYLIRKKNFAWWSKSNYVLGSALDSGTVISIMVIFFVLQVVCLFLYWWRAFNNCVLWGNHSTVVEEGAQL